MCGTFCADIQENLRGKIKFLQYLSDDYDGNGHVYLLSTIVDGEEIIVDPTIGQFLEGHLNTFIGTREQLKNIFMNQTGGGKPYKIINTKSRNNPEEAFRRIYGYKGKTYGTGG